SCNSNTNPIVRTSYSISAGATKNVRLEVTVDSRDNDCSFPGFSATQAVSVSCTASPEGLELTDGDEPGEPDDGDANKNGTTDSIDAALILQFIAGLTDPWPNSDTNENGITNAIDVALILQFSAGLIPSLPV
ncbi:MAG: dockerin type I repeat-containing protein, partial [Chloroflexi bacterium]|nr:dockerin type I repeat-containing protein [Chloroflexota bacterium]